MDVLQSDVKKIVLISCVKKKSPGPCPAENIYISEWFKKAWAYAQSMNPHKTFILSARHHLLTPTAIIESYEATLNNMSAAQRQAWAARLIGQLGEQADLQRDQFIILAGHFYRQYLVGHLAHYTVPMQGMLLGQQLRWLNARLINAN